MSFLKEFSYSEIGQRKILHYNVFLTSLIVGCILTDLTLFLQYHFFYLPVITTLIMCATGGFFFGNLTGRLLYKKIRNSRPLYMASDIIFIVISCAYSSRFFLPADQGEYLLSFFFINQYIYIIFLVIISLIIGVKYNYFLKVSCGDFIDDSQGLVGLVALSLIGFPIGAAAAAITIRIPALQYLYIMYPLMALPSVFLINLNYNPQPQFAKEFEREVEADRKKSSYRDTLIFTYLNFGLIILYYFLGLLTFLKFYGDLSIHSILFHSFSFLFLAAGIAAAGRLKKGAWYIYGEILFPVFFLLFTFVLYYLRDLLPMYTGLFFFIPVSLVIGFILRKTIDNVITGYNHTVRFRILEFSFFILPVPILLTLQLIEFTNLWYFIVVYLLTLVSILVPGLHLLSRGKEGYKKLIYLIFLLALIPLLIFLHAYFGIPMNSRIYISRVENFDILKQVNYSDLFIKQRSTVMMFKEPVFKVSDSIIRNLKRVVVPLYLYVDEDDQVLYIDGNQRFFQNPMIGIYKNVLCLDLLSDGNVDFNKLPLTGRQAYITENEDLLIFMRDAINSGKRFHAIIDMPNLLDQKKNYFRFTKEYYRIMKKGIEPGGIFGQVYSLQDCRAGFFAQSVVDLKKTFKTHVVYLFSDQCLILSSDNEKAFSLQQRNLSHIAGLFTEGAEIKSIFLNEIHVLSHLVFTDIDDLTPYITEREVPRYYLFSQSKVPPLRKEMLTDTIERNDTALRCIDQVPEQGGFRNSVTNLITANKTGVDLLKRLEYAESVDDYENETKYLFELQKYMAYRIELRDYVSQIFSYKERYYYNTALRFEKEKKWENAKKLYNVVLSINSNNFDANYRLGLLYVTLQDIDNSFKYFNSALKIKAEHPKVLYQIGVLYFLSNKTNEAIDYFNKSIAKNEVNPSLFKYLGMCHEKNGNETMAEEYYNKAMVQDPNDTETKTRLDTIRKKKDAEQKHWDTSEQKSDIESEQGVEIPLPINKSAYDIRIKDNDNSLPVNNPPESNDSSGGGR
jgi:tetratricopeptide (TPR) repeat protein